jgi:hypothetical protein
VAVLEGKVEPSTWRAHHEARQEGSPPGTIRLAGNEVALDDGSHRLVMCLDGNASVTWGGDSHGSWRSVHEVYGYAWKAAFLPAGSNRDPSWLTDWFLNGPKDLILRRCTSRSASTKYIRKRGDNPPAEFAGPTTEPGELDHVHVTSGSLDFLVHLVPAELCPGWSRGVGIEYRAPCIPNESTRQAVEEIVSFAIGRRLMRVGSTSFAADGLPLGGECTNPWGSNIPSICSSSDDSPFPILAAMEGSMDVEALLRDLVPRYVERRDEFKLREALVQYWTAEESPLGIDLLLYSAGVELMSGAWFKSTRSKSRGTYLEKARFQELLGDLLCDAEAKLASQPFRDRILRRMKNACHMGSNERIDAFFAEIDLALGESEIAARKARNAPAHGGQIRTNEELLEATRHKVAHKVLFERTFLRLLDYQGSYLDKTTIYHPLRGLDEPAGGRQS